MHFAKRLRHITAIAAVTLLMVTMVAVPAYAKKGGGGSQPQLQLSQVQASNSCGGPGQEVKTTINFGCQHKGNPLLDMTFAIIRFLSYGVGFVLVASLIMGGIQYTTAQSDPQASAAAQKRLQSVIIALLVFVFASAMLDYVIPGQVLK